MIKPQLKQEKQPRILRYKLQFVQRLTLTVTVCFVAYFSYQKWISAGVFDANDDEKIKRMWNRIKMQSTLVESAF